MFLKTCTELATDFDDVRCTMLRRPRPWLEGLAAAAELEGQRLLAEVGLEGPTGPRGPAACLEVGEPVTADRVVSLPLWLRVQGSDRLFPSLEGSLDAAWLGSGRTHLALMAQYAPPFGVLVRTADRALLHRVAEAVAHHFVETAAARLARSPAPEPAE